MTHRLTKDQIIAGSVTLAVALIILILLFVTDLNPIDRKLLAGASIPEPLQPEQIFLEPELDLSTPGDNNLLPEADDAPLPQGEPQKANENTDQLVTPGKSEKAVATTPKTEITKKESPVKTTENRLTAEEEKRLKSMDAKFSNTTQGTKDTKPATVNGQGKVNTSGSLYGRKFKGCDTSTIEVSGKTTIRVSVKVNDKGRVVWAKATKGPKAYYATAEKWAKTARWTEQPGAPEATGTITFTITPK